MNHITPDLSEPCPEQAQIKSRERVSTHGEVFTADREVNAMLDLVQSETERIDSRFLEPACGTGNFLIRILERKLRVVSTHYASSRTDYEFNSLHALTSIYGIDIQMDNVEECRQRLYRIFYDTYTQHFPKANDTDHTINFLASVRHILTCNIVWGDALTLLLPDGSSPIIFAEWSALPGMMFNRRDFTMDNLVNNRPPEGLTLFSDLDDPAFMPFPIAEYEPTHYLKLTHRNTNTYNRPLNS